jgi:hypothetical protein
VRYRRRNVEDRPDRRRRVLREIEDRELNDELRYVDSSRGNKDDWSAVAVGGDASDEDTAPQGHDGIARSWPVPEEGDSKG